MSSVFCSPKVCLGEKRYLTLWLVFALVSVLSCAPSPRTAPPISPVPPAATPTPAPAPVQPPAPTPAPTPAPAANPPGFVPAEAVDGGEVSFAGEGLTIGGYLARPKSGTNLPALLVIHENRGLTPHIRDVARRFANQGYVALAPDLLSRAGGTGRFATTDEAVAAIGRLSQENVTKDLDAAFSYLQSLPGVKADTIGVIGYCWGGGNSLLYATRNPKLKAAIVYYGPNPANIDDVANITAPVLGIYGADDTRITVNVSRLEEAMKKYSKSFEFKIYPGTAHAFFNDTGARYNPTSAADAWLLTTSFLQRNLR